MFGSVIKNNKFKLLKGIFIGLLISFFNIMDVYAYKITFNQARGEWIVGTCYTDSNGMLSPGCINVLEGVCNRWSPDSADTWNDLTVPGFERTFDREQWVSHICVNSNCTTDGCTNYCDKDNVTGTELTHGYLDQKKFEQDGNYYCVINSSSNDTEENHDKCYVCNANDNIMKWSIDGNGDAQCEGGYKESTTITEEGLCVTRPQSCYECETDKNVMGWGYSPEDVKNNDSGACSGNYKASTTVTDKNLCVTKRPACYVCKDEGKEYIMGWGIELNTLDGCNQVEKSTTITEEDLCVTKSPACYVCKDEGKEYIMGWGIELNTLDGCNQVEKSTTITEEDLCVTKRPACYVCDSDNKIMGWGYSAIEVKNRDTENLCNGNYIKDENINEDMCITNIETGQTGVYIIVIGFIMAFLYIVYYYFKHVRKTVN